MAKRNVSYGRAFTRNGRKVAYRYVNKDKRTKTLVDFKTKKPIQRSGMPMYDKKRRSRMPRYK